MNDHILARPRALRMDFISEPLRRIRKNKKFVLGSPPFCLSILLHFIESLGSFPLFSVLRPHLHTAYPCQRALCSKVPTRMAAVKTLLQEQVWPVKKTVSWRCQAPSGRTILPLPSNCTPSHLRVSGYLACFPSYQCSPSWSPAHLWYHPPPPFAAPLVNQNSPGGGPQGFCRLEPRPTLSTNSGFNPAKLTVC